ncbi:hypothetical protein L596_018485 [Steinernema carpocapsae]|uniref:Uncharacterized protein n=1 Tax=Steinernema carpocapsae TaxID=34508 RepID=A0A4U5N5U1_STECR|nr:hypothetical protein L596_018485 [Steinernema carpocapsae]
MLIPSLHTPFFACSISQPLIPSSSKSATFRFFPSPPSSSRNSNNSCLIRLFRRSSAASQLAQFELTVAAPLLIPSFTLAPRIILLRIAGDLFLGSSGTSQIDRSVRRTNTSHGGFWRRLRHLRPAPPEGPLLAHHESRILLHDPDRAHRLHKCGADNLDGRPEGGNDRDRVPVVLPRPRAFLHGPLRREAQVGASLRRPPARLSHQHSSDDPDLVLCRDLHPDDHDPKLPYPHPRPHDRLLLPDSHLRGLSRVPVLPETADRKHARLYATQL